MGNTLAGTEYVATSGHPGLDNASGCILDLCSRTMLQNANWVEIPHDASAVANRRFDNAEVALFTDINRRSIDICRRRFQIIHLGFVPVLEGEGP